MSDAGHIELSIIIPFYNEEENVATLYHDLKQVLDSLAQTFEIIFVDDGSTDHGHDNLCELAKKDSTLKIIRFTRNFGQTAAMQAGFREARGHIYITMDADNQNDPKDIPKLLLEMKKGFGVVSGWRKDRHDKFLTRRLPSVIANWLISTVTGVRLNDYGCTLKAYEARFISLLNLYGEMHRFIPAFASLIGANISEVTVSHRPRTKGKSKYGLSRIFKVVLDLLTVKFLGDFATNPIYFFGGSGFVLNIASVAIGGLVLYQKYFNGVFAHRNPLLLLAVFLSVLGFILIMMGLIAEMLMRTYHESQNKSIYIIRDVVNVD